MLQHVLLLVQCREHITPVLRQLHWLPVWQCIKFKLAVLVYKALNGLSLKYLAEDCQLTSTTGRRRRLRSFNVATCEVSITRQVWAIAHSLLLDRVFGTTYLSIYVTLNILFWNSAGYWRYLFCRGQRRPLLFEHPINLHLCYIT